MKMALTLFVIISLVFFATRLSGSPLETFLGDGLTEEDRQLMIEYFGLDGSIWEQYLLLYARPGSGGQFWPFVPGTPPGGRDRGRADLALASTAFGRAIADDCPCLAAGHVLAALYRTSWIGSAIMALAFVGYAVPNFVIATFMVLIFRVYAELAAGGRQRHMGAFHHADHCHVGCADRGADALYPQRHAGCARARISCGPRGPRACPKRS